MTATAGKADRGRLAALVVLLAVFAIMLLANVLWCQEVWHWSAIRTGIALVPGPALVPVVTLLTSRTVRRLGHGPLVAAGGVLFAAGMVWRTVFVSTTPAYLTDLLPSMLLTGTAVGLSLGTLVAAGVQLLPADRAATGSALVNAVRQIASTVGVAVLVTVVGSRVSAASVGGFRVAWGVGAVLGLATTAAGLLLRPARGPARPVAPGAVAAREPVPEEPGHG